VSVRQSEVTGTGKTETGEILYTYEPFVGHQCSSGSTQEARREREWPLALALAESVRKCKAAIGLKKRFFFSISLYLYVKSYIFPEKNLKTKVQFFLVSSVIFFSDFLFKNAFCH